MTAGAVSRRLRLLVIAALTVSTAVWGSTFSLSKQVIARHDPMTVIALRLGSEPCSCSLPAPGA